MDNRGGEETDEEQGHDGQDHKPDSRGKLHTNPSAARGAATGPARDMPIWKKPASNETETVTKTTYVNATRKTKHTDKVSPPWAQTTYLRFGK